MNPSKTLRNVACAVVIASATAGSFSVTAQETATVTVQVPSAKAVFRGARKVVTKLSPYAAALYYFFHEPTFITYLASSKKIDTETKENVLVPNENLERGTRKILDAVVGALFLEAVKEDTKYVKELASNFIDFLVPAA